MCENIKRDNNRVDIAKLEENDISGNECYLAHGNLKQYYDLRDGKIVRNDKDYFEPAPCYFYEREKIK